MCSYHGEPLQQKRKANLASTIAGSLLEIRSYPVTATSFGLPPITIQDDLFTEAQPLLEETLRECAEEI